VIGAKHGNAPTIGKRPAFSPRQTISPLGIHIVLGGEKGGLIRARSKAGSGEESSYIAFPR